MCVVHCISCNRFNSSKTEVDLLCFQVTFEQHKENLSRMFRQYQHQEAGGPVRTIAGVSQSMEQMESVNGSPAEDLAPSTVIELTVDSPPSPTAASSPTEPPGDSFAVSNILEGAREDEEKQDEEADAAVTQENEKQSEEEDEEQPGVDDPQTLVGDGEVSGGGVAEDSTTEVPVREDKTESGPSDAEEGPTNEGDMEELVDSELEARSEVSSRLDNSALGGASVFNEDLVDVSSVSDQVQPSDADDSQEESSSIPGPAGEEEEEESQHKQDEGEDMKDEKQENGGEGKTQESETQPDDVTETAKEDDSLEPSSTITPTTPAERTSETTTALTAAEAPAPSASTSDGQPPPEAAAEAPTTSEHGNAAASSSGRTKEIKIARLDVSSVASDTERLELKETVGLIHLDLNL